MGLLNGERALLDRSERSATFLLGSADDDGRIVHPLLTAAGVIFAWWHGLEALHAGAFTTPQGAWRCVGGQGEQGKSSMLARLALAGRPVLTDDLLIVNGKLALAGPRCLDLRENGLGPAGLDGMTKPCGGASAIDCGLDRSSPKFRFGAGSCSRGEATSSCARSRRPNASSTSRHSETTQGFTHTVFFSSQVSPDGS